MWAWPIITPPLSSASWRSQFICLIIHHCATDHSLEAAVVVRRRAEDDGLDEERLVAVALLVAPNDAEAPAAWVAPSQYNLMTTVQVAVREEQGAE